jgi:c-di-GMP-binding flagellar brake protein YcgR
MSDEPLRGSLRAEVRACLDLSAGGALLLLETPLDVSAIYDFALDLGDETLTVQAEVRHLTRVETKDGGDGYQIGVHFIGIDPRDEARLREYVAGIDRA